MQRALAVAGVLALCTGLPVHAQTQAPLRAPPALPVRPPPPPGVNPFAWYYPERAQRMEVDGKAVMTCDVNEAYRLEACALVSETPEGWGFGAATLEVSRYFKFKPKLDADGKPAPRGRVTVPLTWSVPRDETPAKAK